MAASLLLVGLLVSLASCGPSRRSRGGGTSDVIVRSEVERVPDRSAFGLIRLLRPRWLLVLMLPPPPRSTPVYARVYVDNLEYGPLESLYDISSNIIDQINFINSLDATTFYGTGFMGGLIQSSSTMGCRSKSLRNERSVKSCLWYGLKSVEGVVGTEATRTPLGRSSATK